MPKRIKVADIAAFEEARALVARSGIARVSEKETYVDRDGSIRWGDAAFEAQREEFAAAKSGERGEKHSLAERFLPLYDRTQGGDNAWSVFAEGLVSAIYQKNALLIYEPITSDQEADGYVRRIVEAIKLLNGKLDQRLRCVKTEGVAEKICIASVKLRLDLGGAPIPTVVPFYFKLNGDGRSVEQLPPERARALNRQIAALAKRYAEDRSEKRETTAFAGNYGALVAAVTAELQKTLTDADGFGNDLILDGEARRAAVDLCVDQWKIADAEENARAAVLVKKARARGLTETEEDELIALTDSVSFAATGAQLRYVAILDCYCPTYELFDQDDPDGKKRYDVSFDLAWKADVRCGRCGETLIKENAVKLKNRDVILNLAGGAVISNEDLNDLQNEECAFAFHARKKTCEWVGGSCEELVCDGDLIRCDRCDEEFRFCKNCRHPEIVYQIEENGETVPYHTKHLKFCRDTFGLLPEERVNRCRICGRTYSEAYLTEKDGVCKFCAPLIGGVKDEALYRKLFYEHRRMLPYWKRAGKRNLCNEDDAIILFKAGGKLYRLDKSSVKEGGMLKLKRVQPEKTEKAKGASHGGQE